MLKKFMLMTVAAFFLVGCDGEFGFGGNSNMPEDEELGPEYSTKPVISNVTFAPTTPTDREAVTVRASLSSKYGFKFVYIVFQLDGEEETTIVGERRFTDSSQTSFNYEGVIPGQRTGSVVKFCVFTRSYYGVGMASEVMQYVVAKDSESVDGSAVLEFVE